MTLPVSHQLTFYTDMNHPNAAMTGAIVATYIAGETIGAMLQMAFGDKLGRKRFMQALCLVVSLLTRYEKASMTEIGMYRSLWAL